MASVTPKLSQYKVLMFDVYGTLVDWETGIMTALQPIVAGTSLESKSEALRAFENVETDLQARYPSMRYSELLAHTHAELDARLRGQGTVPEPGSEGGSTQTAVQAGTKEVGSTEVGTSASAQNTEETDGHVAFGKSIANWPVFPDTIPALEYLSKHFRLTVLSNVDRASFAATQRALEGPPDGRRFAFSAVYTAEDAEFYKPDPRARQYALRRVEEELSVKSDEVMVVANSVFHDVMPARKMGLGTAWIERKGSVIGHDQEEGAKATFRFSTLGEMAEALKREVGESS
ncbi:HAD-like protein [Laetiporus sulphureus 93-53]|uniref:HAD-like protein n=1 Tax=Laetiporus sulphureus 93-53 TaxID=1314785 RepID=A0A165CYA7_9APHY|nr:HAD-like protein [Laetiporus sulphureus 93-53]KZT03734.1 HAD-like protein [Laetiporus sulphureus 93-53]